MADNTPSAPETARLSKTQLVAILTAVLGAITAAIVGLTGAKNTLQTAIDTINSQPDAGVTVVIAGRAGSAGAAIAGKGGAGSSGAVSVAGSAGAAPHDHSQHGGTAVQLPLPIGNKGSATLDLQRTGELPARADDGVGAFRSVCKFSHANFDDPIVYQDQPSKAHLHVFFGNTTTDAFSTYDKLVKNGNGSCRGGIANRSAYWVPGLLDGDGKMLVPAEMHVYYKRGYRVSKTATVEAPPAGLRLIAGNMKATAAQSQSVVAWKCWEKFIGTFTTPAAVAKDCPQGDFVSQELFFPQCWDGKNLDSADHMSHMTYGNGKGCPATHPKVLPELSYHILYKVSDVKAAGPAIHLSSDMYDFSGGKGGYSAHGDWILAWQPDLPAVFTSKCVQPNNDCKSHMLGDGRVMN